MITLPHNANESILLKCIKQVGQFETDMDYWLHLRKMTGRIYKEGKHLINGKSEWIDTQGQEDNRIMIYSSLGESKKAYKVFKDMAEVNAHFVPAITI